MAAKTLKTWAGLRPGDLVWTEFSTPDAASDRGLLKAVTAAYEYDRHADYSYDSMPVFDEELGAWREQSTLGNYLDYGPDHYRPELSRVMEPGNIHCCCYASRTSRYVETVAEAKAWILGEVRRVRPELGSLAGEVK